MAIGDIGAVIDTLVCNASASLMPRVAHVYGDIYAILWRQAATDGYICTVQIDSTGQITDSVIETYHFESTTCVNPRIIEVKANIFAIVYQFTDNDGMIRTFEIANDGNITTPAIDSFEFETTICSYPHICKLADNVFVVAYETSNDDGKIATIGIADNGQITEPVIDSWVFDAGYVRDAHIVKVGDGVVAIFLGDFLEDGWVKTVAISPVGTIAESIIDSLKFEVGSAVRTFAVNLTGSIWAATYHDTLNDGWITTMKILANGKIADAYAGRFEFNNSYGKEPTHVLVDGHIMAIAYEKSATSGEIYTLSFTDAGVKVTAPIDTLSYDTTLAGWPYIFHVTGNVFAVAYIGPNSYITLKTFDISTPGFPKHLMLTGIG